MINFIQKCVSKTYRIDVLDNSTRRRNQRITKSMFSVFSWFFKKVKENFNNFISLFSEMHFKFTFCSTSSKLSIFHLVAWQYSVYTHSEVSNLLSLFNFQLQQYWVQVFHVLVRRPNHLGRVWVQKLLHLKKVCLSWNSQAT